MTPRHSGFAVAGLLGVLGPGAPPILAEPSQIGIELDNHVALKSEAPFETTIPLFDILPDGSAADVGPAAGDVVLNQVPRGSARALADVHWTSVGAGSVSGWLGPQIGAAPVAEAWDGRDGLGRGMLPLGAGWRLDGAAGDERPALLVGIADREPALDPGLHLGDARCDLDQRHTDGVEPGGAPERGRRRQATRGVPEPAGGVDQEAELIHLDAEGAVGDAAQLLRMIKSSAWPDWQ